MNRGTYFLCCLNTVNDFYDEIFQKISSKARDSIDGYITVELTSYANYCLELLQQNGLSVTKQAREALEFMWFACPALVLQVLGYSDCIGEWQVVGNQFFLNIELY